MATKLKVFMPYRYYPLEDSILKDVMFVVPYSLTLLAFFWIVSTRRCFTSEHVILLIAIGACAVQGLVYFMLSRHLYGIIVVMIVFVGLLAVVAAGTAWAGQISVDDPVFGADGLDGRLDAMQMTMVHTGKQMVLDL